MVETTRLVLGHLRPEVLPQPWTVDEVGEEGVLRMPRQETVLGGCDCETGTGRDPGRNVDTGTTSDYPGTTGLTREGSAIYDAPLLTRHKPRVVNPLHFYKAYLVAR